MWGLDAVWSDWRGCQSWLSTVCVTLGKSRRAARPQLSGLHDGAHTVCQVGSQEES